ncbi:MAG: hypothetical protein C0601_06280 [Candidatus Muiribacterium halophilum]|uniref:Uncharacterized protein n=1 Tax=Muiribacterium halophilum TaxID=2053465 RepID=A0A2N5ZGQ9_MUIH1|nr:MAG: hypothetical protein C0601_06280 [Candidatus Muirbacterium halophilum]
MKRILILFLIITVMLLADSVDEQLKQSGYKNVLESLHQDKQTNVRYRSVYPDENRDSKKTVADQIYGDDYVIRSADEDGSTLKDRIVMYYPAIQGPSLLVLTGLVNTVSARSLKKGSYSIGGRFIYSKITKSKGTDIDFQEGEKAEVTSFYVNAAMGVSDNFEIGYMLPVHKLEVIDDNLYPYNASESGAGDVAIRGKFSFPFNNDMGNAAVGFGVKLPSGNDEKLSPTGVTGEPDLEVLGAVSGKFGTMTGHINLIYSFTGNGDVPNKPFTFSDDKFTFNVGIDYSKNENVSLMMEINGEDWGSFGDRADLVAGVRAKMGEKLNGEIAFPLSIHNNQYYGYDFKLIVGASYTF